MALDTSKPIMQRVGNYDLIEKVAEGGMGTVYRGRHRESGQIVAVKIVPPNMASNDVLLKRFEQEFKAASRLDHPNIVRAIDFGEEGSTPYLVMEFVEGESLGQKIEREGRISENESIRLIAQVAQGLYKAHRHGLIHRDVKPDNILVSPEGVAKLADLGLVKEVEADLNLTRTGRGLGTPHFMAPEQFRDAKNAEVRCDIYSLGATLYMMVTGELPFKSSGPLDAWMKKVNNELIAPRKVVPALSERLDWAIRRSMSANPEQRPTSCREFVEDLTGHSTRRVTPVDQGQPQDIWYLVYKDEDDVQHTVKGTTPGIRRSLKEGLLGDAGNIRASKVKAGPYESLRGFPEFRDLVVKPEPMPPKAKPNSVPASALPGTRTNPISAQKTPANPSPTLKTPNDSDAAPHIELDTLDEGAGGSEWIKWVLLFLIMVASAVIFFFLIRLK